MNPVVKRIDNSKDTIIFWCPGCEMLHRVLVGRNGWVWNGDEINPTFDPSVLVTGDKIKCHLFVRNGNIEFLSDSIHALAGKTVRMTEIEKVI